MFKNEFQGGLFLDILSAQGKDFGSKCKIVGCSTSGGQREFDKSIRSNVLLLEGESTRSKIVIPKDEKSSLYISQPFLLFQINIPPGASFSLETVVADSSNQKRRILMSTSYKEISVTAFHVKVPLTVLKRGVWLNLCLDLSSFVSNSFNGQRYKALESIVVCANCKLRRIFSMKTQPRDNVTEDLENHVDGCEEIPRSLQFAIVPDSQLYTQVLNMQMLMNSDVKFRVGSGIKAPSANMDNNETLRSDKSEKTHIAFGSRVAVPKYARKTPGKHLPDNLERQLSSTSLSSSGGLNSSSSHVDLNESTTSTLQLEVQKPILQPRPPKPSSGKSTRRPNPRIRSAESANVVKRAKLKSNSAVEKDALESSNEEQKIVRARNVDENTVINMERLNSRNNNEQNKDDGNMDMNNNNNDNNGGGNSEANGDEFVEEVPQKFVLMKMGSEDDEENYFRRRRFSENQDETRQSKEGSFSSSNENDALFLYSSRPRSISSGTKIRKALESSTKNLPLPDVVVDQVEDDDTRDGNNSNNINKIASLESDFHRHSSDSDNDDLLEKFHRLEGSQRTSPRSSPSFLSKTEESMSIKSSLLKEIPKPQQSYNHLRYTSAHSDSMSWMYDSDSSQLTHNDMEDGSELDHSMNDKLHPIKHDNDLSPRQQQQQQPRLRILEHLPEGMELGNDSDDAISDASDETSYSTWKEPPAHIRNYRYQDEMRGVGMTLDLSATLPMTPFIEEKKIPVKRQDIDNTDSGVSVQDSRSFPKEDGVHNNEDELDLLFDPVLNCYYDPHSHKYYVLT
eukprot:gene18284-20108_t